MNAVYGCKGSNKKSQTVNAYDWDKWGLVIKFGDPGSCQAKYAIHQYAEAKIDVKNGAEVSVITVFVLDKGIRKATVNDSGRKPHKEA